MQVWKRLFLVGLISLGLTTSSITWADATPSKPAHQWRLAYWNPLCVFRLRAAWKNSGIFENALKAATPYNLMSRLAPLTNQIGGQKIDVSIMTHASYDLESDLNGGHFETIGLEYLPNEIHGSLVLPFFEITTRNVTKYRRRTFLSTRPRADYEADYEAEPLFPDMMDAVEYIFTHVDHTTSKIIIFRSENKLSRFAIISNGPDKTPDVMSHDLTGPVLQRWNESSAHEQWSLANGYTEVERINERMKLVAETGRPEPAKVAE